VPRRARDQKVDFIGSLRSPTRPSQSQDDNDNIREGRITMKPTIEQKALIAASKPGIDLLLEELRRSHEFFHVSHPICAGTPPAVADVLIVLQHGVHVLMQDGIMKVNVVEKLSDTELKARWHWESSHAAW
jgi:hypothetical protein